MLHNHNPGVSTAFKTVKMEHIESNLEGLESELPLDAMRDLTTTGHTVTPCMLQHRDKTLHCCPQNFSGFAA